MLITVSMAETGFSFSFNLSSHVGIVDTPENYDAIINAEQDIGEAKGEGLLCSGHCNISDVHEGGRWSK